MHFVPKDKAYTVEVRAYDRLFTADFPGEKTGEILDDVNKDSKIVYTNAKIHKDALKDLKVEDRF